MRKQMKELENEPHGLAAQQSPLSISQTGQIAAHQPNRSLTRPFDSGGKVQECGLSASAATDDGHLPSLGDAEGDVPHCGERNISEHKEGLGNIFKRQGWWGLDRGHPAGRQPSLG